MKKLLSMLLASTLCLSLAACGSTQSNPGTSSPEDSKQSSQSDSSDTSKDAQKTEHSYEEDPDLPGIHKVNMTSVQYCINSPSWLIKRNGCGHKVSTDSFVILYGQYVNNLSDKNYGIDLEKISSAEDIFPNMNKQIVANIDGTIARADEYVVEVDNTENLTINGWDMCKQKGSIKLTYQHALPYESTTFVAYSVIKDGCPVFFMVIDKPDGSERIDIEEMADKIAKTFREYSED